MGKFLARILRRLRAKPAAPLEELGLDQAADERRTWRPDIPGSGAQGPS